MKRSRLVARPASLALQLLVVASVIGLLVWFGTNTVDNLARRGITGGFDFLGRSARFPISESILGYRPSDSFAWALFVGLGNTLFISAAVCIAATALGLGVALARRSDHPLLNGLSSVFVEVMRNTPLVVQLLFWYALVTVGLPNVHQALNPGGGIFLSDRGLFLPLPGLSGPAIAVGTVLALAVAALLSATILSWRVRARGGAVRHAGYALAGLLVIIAGIVWFSAGVRISVDTPRFERFNFVGGFEITPEAFAMLLGLTLYSAAFVGEIIRGGIDAIARGQWEAGRALGLRESQTLYLVIMPQALRIIIPPMTSQYINIVKNSTLALVVGYPDISFVTSTTINQTGQAVEGVLILMVVFLTISLVASLLLNLVNRRLALVQR